MPIKNAYKLRIEKPLKNFVPQEFGYTVPWALVIDTDGNAYLNINYDTREHKIDEYILRVKKLSEEKTDYEVDVGTVSNYSWGLVNDITEYAERYPNMELVKIGRLDFEEIERQLKLDAERENNRFNVKKSKIQKILGRLQLKLNFLE